MNVTIKFPEGAFDPINDSFNKLCDAEKALKKAYRRALIVRTVEKVAWLTIGIVVYKHITDKEDEE